MGKTADGAVWLDPALTPPFAFYQCWLNALDADVERFLRYFTFLAADEVTALAEAHAADPAKRAGQRCLAEEVTRFVHGPDGLDKARRVTRVLFECEDWRTLDARDLEVAFEDAPTSDLDASLLGGPEAALTSVLAKTELFKSRSQARTGVEQGGVSINNRAVDSAQRVLARDDLLPGGYVVLRKGKKHYHVLRVLG